MQIFVTVTKEQTRAFPLHRHDLAEMLYYLLPGFFH